MSKYNKKSNSKNQHQPHYVQQRLSFQQAKNISNTKKRIREGELTNDDLYKQLRNINNNTNPNLLTTFTFLPNNFKRVNNSKELNNDKIKENNGNEIKQNFDKSFYKSINNNINKNINNNVKYTFNKDKFNDISNTDYHGFINTGSICYICSTLAILSNIPSFYEKLNTNSDDCIIRELSLRIKDSKEGNKNADIKLFHFLFSRKYSNFSNGQQDAHEFYLSLIDHLSKNNSELSNLFKFHIRCKIRCKKCYNYVLKDEECCYLGLNLVDYLFTLDELISNYFVPSDIEYECLICGNKTSEMSLKFIDFPKVLVISLNVYFIFVFRDLGKIQNQIKL